MNKGSIWQRGKLGNAWQIQVYINGKRHYEMVRGKKRDAQRRLNELLVNKDKGILVPTGRMTVAQHLDNWFNGYIKTNTSARTIESVQSIIQRHLSPAFGNTLLQKLVSCNI